MYNVLISITDKGGGAKGKAGEDVFEDLLGSQGFSFSSGKDAGPRTMAEMKKVELAKNMDPEKLKVLYCVKFCLFQPKHCGEDQFINPFKSSWQG